MKIEHNVCFCKKDREHTELLTTLEATNYAEMSSLLQHCLVPLLWTYVLATLRVYTAIDKCYYFINVASLKATSDLLICRIILNSRHIYCDFGKYVADCHIFGNRLVTGVSSGVGFLHPPGDSQYADAVSGMVVVRGGGVPGRPD